MKPISFATTPAGPTPGRACHAPQVWMLLALLTGLHGSGWATCIDEVKPEPAAAAASSAVPPAAINSRSQLQALVQAALQRSNGIGAARLLAEAADQDVNEARASTKPVASLNVAVSPELNTGNTGAPHSSLQARGGVTVSQTIYDGGRSDRIVDWRRYQAEAARLGMLSTQEQITLSTTSMAFERSRFRMQAVIWGQHVRKMGCLVEALTSIVSADKGRTSELVQARKQLQLAELQQVQSMSQARQVEAKLRRIAGDGLPGTEGMGSLLLTVPELPEVLMAAERSSDISQLDANTKSLREMVRVVEAANKPQLSWNVGSSAMLAAAAGTSRTAGLNAGIAVTIPLLNPSLEYSTQAARKRADAAALQRAEVLEQRRGRIVETHEQATAAFDRVKRVGQVLRDSELLRNYTLQQWQQLGRRSLFDVIAAESDHYNLRVQYVNALHDGQQMNATLLSLGVGLSPWLN